MNEHLKNTLLLLNPRLKKAELSLITESLVECEYKYKDKLVDAGKRQNGIFYLTQGSTRTYYLDNNGKEQTIGFSIAGEFTVHYTALIRNKPSRYNIQALEEVKAYLLHYDSILLGYEKYHQIDKLGRIIAENIMSAQQQRIEDFQFLTAKERYLKLLNTRPDLVKKVSITNLASYLGIERPSLSRIRKEIQN